MARFNPVGIAFQAALEQIAIGIAEASDRTLNLAGKNFQNMSNLFRDQVLNRGTIAEVNQVVADVGHAAMLTAYTANVLDARAASPYRTSDRFSGDLLRALQSPSMAVGTSAGIQFVDVGLLDATARHWARLNFGAGPASGFTTGPAFRPPSRLQFGSNQGISFQLSEGPRPNFNVPGIGYKGFFNSGGQFFILRPGVRPKPGDRVLQGRPSQSGIAPRHFIDAGVSAIAASFGPAYRSFFLEGSVAAVREAFA